MTERERIEIAIGRCEDNLDKYQRFMAAMRSEIDEYREQLAALPPEPPDLSPWHPERCEDFFYEDVSGEVSDSTNSDTTRRSIENAERTVKDVERMIPHTRLVRRMRQCFYRLYENGWEPKPSDIRYVITRRLNGELIVSNRCSTLPTVTEVSFQSAEHAQWVLDQLESEGLL